jgi:hypothetical protein
MAEFTSNDVINKIRALKLRYIENNIGQDPAQLPTHFAEFLGYATLLYDHFATALRDYRLAEAKITKEENANRAEVNASTKERSEKITVGESDQRITVRLSTYRARRDYLEQEVKGATLHINGCQSLMKNWGDEAKGIR